MYFQQQVRKLFPFLVMVAVKMTTGQVYLILVSVHHMLNQQCAFSIYNAANYLFFYNYHSIKLMAKVENNESIPAMVFKKYTIYV